MPRRSPASTRASKASGSTSDPPAVSALTCRPGTSAEAAALQIGLLRLAGGTPEHRRCGAGSGRSGGSRRRGRARSSMRPGGRRGGRDRTPRPARPCPRRAGTAGSRSCASARAACGRAHRHRMARHMSSALASVANCRVSPRNTLRGIWSSRMMSARHRPRSTPSRRSSPSARSLPQGDDSPRTASSNASDRLNHCSGPASIQKVSKPRATSSSALVMFSAIRPSALAKIENLFDSCEKHGTLATAKGASIALRPRPWEKPRPLGARDKGKCR